MIFSYENWVASSWLGYECRWDMEWWQCFVSVPSHPWKNIALSHSPPLHIRRLCFINSVSVRIVNWSPSLSEWNVWLVGWGWVRDIYAESGTGIFQQWGCVERCFIIFSAKFMCGQENKTFFQKILYFGASYTTELGYSHKLIIFSSKYLFSWKEIKLTFY